MAQAAQLEHFEPSQKYPEYLPFNPSQLLRDAIQNDTEAFQRSDKDFAKRHSTLLGAEKGVEGMIGKDVANIGKIPSAVQNELYRSGLTGALGSFDAAGNAGLFDGDSAGAASVGRSLGVGANNFVRQQKADALAELSTGEALFPRRQFGFGGETDTLLNMLNTTNMNNWNQGEYADQTMNDQFNWQIDAANMAAQIQQQNNDSQAKAAKTAAVWGAISDGIQTVVGAAGGMGGMCWVARAAFGDHDARWLQFRNWMLSRAPRVIREFYRQHGERIAQEVRRSPELKSLFRSAMLKHI